MTRKITRLTSFCLCMMLIFTLCSCDTSDIWVFSLNGEKLYEKEVAAFAFVYATERNIRDNGQLEEIYADSKTYEEFYKDELEEEIVSSTLLYKEAQENKLKLSNEEKKQIETSVNSVVTRYGEDVLEKHEVSTADIEKVCEMRMLGDAYLKGLSNGEIDNTKEKESQQKKDEPDSETMSSNRYIEVYQVTFPTIELDDSGIVKTDAEGKLKKLPATEIAAKKEDAAVFAESVKQGESMEKLLETCEKDVLGVTKHLKYEDLEKEYKAAVDKMTVGDVSDVVESDYGYCVFKLVKDEDAEYANTMDNYQQEMDILEVESEELERLRSEYAQENRGYKNTSLWETIRVKDYIQ